MPLPQPRTINPRELRAKADQNFFFFCKVVLGFEIFHEDLHHPLCDFFASKHRKKMVLIPRGHLKTSIARAYCLWRYVNFKDIRVLVVSSTEGKSADMLSGIKKFVMEETAPHNFKLLYPDCVVNKKWRSSKDHSWNETSISLPHPSHFANEDTFMALSVGGSPEGYHFDLIILDDLIDQKAARSEKDMEQAIYFFNNHEPLFNEIAKGETIVIGTRYGLFDLYQNIMDHMPTYKIFYRSCVRDKVTKEPAYSLNPETVEPIYPERFPLDELNRILTESEHGSWHFSCHYYVLPINEENRPFKEQDLRFFNVDESGHGLMLEMKNGVRVNPNDCDRIMVVDPASSREKSNHACDSSVVILAKHESGRVYVLEAWGEKVNPNELIAQMFALNDRWHPRCCYIEDIAFQGALMWLADKTLSYERRKFCRMEPINPGGRAKDDRILGLQPYIERHQIYLRHDSHKLRNQIIRYQTGHVFSKKDILDALAYAPLVWKLPMSISDYNRVTGQELDGYEDDYDVDYIPQISIGRGRDAYTGY